MKQTSSTVKNLGGNLLEKQFTIVKRSFKSSTKPLSLDSTIPINELTTETFYHFRTSELFNIWTPPFCMDPSSLWETAKVLLKKRESFEWFERYLSFWVSGVELPLIFYTKRKKKKPNTEYMTKLFHSHWLNKKEYIFDKLSITWLWVLVINYQIITWLFVLVTIYPK